MSEIKALEDMRKELRVCGCDPDECVGCSVPGKVREHADRIEAEIAERFVELPVDADGVTIHVGDVVVSRDWCEPRKVTGFAVLCRTSDGGCVWNEPCELEHYKPRTLEGVLRDVWKEALDYAKSDMWRNPDEVFAERAAEIRELLGVSE